MNLRSESWKNGNKPKSFGNLALWNFFNWKTGNIRLDMHCCNYLFFWSHFHLALSFLCTHKNMAAIVKKEKVRDGIKL